MKLAGRRKSSNIEDRRNGNDAFSIYAQITNEGNDQYRRQSLGKRAAQAHKARQKKINTKTTRLKMK